MTVKELVPLTAEQQALVKGAMSLVDKIAQTLAPRYHSLVHVEELVGLGREGLVQAARVYDPALGVPFASFANYRVQGAMLDGIRKESTRAREIQIAMRASACDFMSVQRHQGDVMTDTEEDQRRRLDAMAEGLAAALFSEMVGTATRKCADSDEEAVAVRDSYAKALAALDKATSTLAPKDKKLIDLHYHEQRDLKEVAVELGVSYATIRRHHQTVMERLAIRLRSQGVSEPPETP